MPIPAGRLSRRVRFERLSSGQNDYGEESGSWTGIADCWAWPMFGTGAERRAAAQEQASAPATFRVRRCAITAGLTAKDRIRFDPFSGATELGDAPLWDIVSVVPFERDGIDIAAVRSVS